MAVLLGSRGARDARSGLHLADALLGSRGELTRARVCIVGAGAAGLAAAHALRAAGFERVTVLERSERVGGKCWSFHHEGRAYEMGAVVLSPAYRSVRALMREVDLEPAPKMSSALFLDVETRRAARIRPVFRGGTPMRSMLALARLQAELVRHHRLRRPGFAGANDTLATPFLDWLRARKLTAAVGFIEPWVTPLGYGYLQDIPALYILKYLPLIRFPVSEIDDGGYQELWNRVARRLDVRCNVDIRAIRRGTEVTLETSRGTLTFDVLLLACPLDEALGFLDASEEERRLFSLIRYRTYHVFAAFTEGLPDARWVHFPGHFSPEHAGWPLFMLRRWSSSPLRIFYTLADPSQGLDFTEERLHETVRKLGGRVTGIHRRHAWRYFPHVSSADVSSGYYEALERLQGQRSTYYVGELMSFATVEHVVAYARDLVARFFVTKTADRHAK